MNLLALRQLETYFYEDELTRCWYCLWEAEIDAPVGDAELRLQREEVAAVRMMTATEIFAEAEAAACDDSGGNRAAPGITASGRRRFTADGVECLRRYLVGSCRARGEAQRRPRARRSFVRGEERSDGRACLTLSSSPVLLA